MAAEKAKDPLEGLDPVSYPSKDQLQSGDAAEPSQTVGDYATIRSQYETGRVFSSVKDLGTEDGAGPGTEVCRRGSCFEPEFFNIMRWWGGVEVGVMLPATLNKHGDFVINPFLRMNLSP